MKQALLTSLLFGALGSSESESRARDEADSVSESDFIVPSVPSPGEASITPSQYEKLKSQVQRAIERQDEILPDEGDLPAALVRAVFHDCGTYGTGSMSGCHGCLLQPCNVAGQCARDDPDNNGLQFSSDFTINLYNELNAAQFGLTLADFMILCGNVAVEYTSDNGIGEIPFQTGRTDCDGDYLFADALPKGTLGAEEVMRVFDRLNMSKRQAVSLIGAHTLGRCEIQNSGFIHPWVNHQDRFQARYFKFMIDKEWTRATNSAGNEQFGDGDDVEDSEFMMLYADVAFAYNINDNDGKCNINTGGRNECSQGPYYNLVEHYAENEEFWFQDFKLDFAELATKTDDTLVPVAGLSDSWGIGLAIGSVGGLLAVVGLGSGFKSFMTRRAASASELSGEELSGEDFETGPGGLETMPELETVTLYEQGSTDSQL